MDLSKLPKLSQTPPPPSQAEPPPPAVTDDTDDPKPDPQVELFCQCGAPIVAGTNFCSTCGASYRDITRGRGVSANGDLGGPLWVEAFLSIAVGLFLMLMAPTGIQYLKAKVTGATFAPYPAVPGSTEPVDFLRFTHPTTGVQTDYKYTELFNAYWGDMAITWFAIALVVEGIVLAIARNRWVVLVALLLVVSVTALNLWYCVSFYSRTYPVSLTNQTYAQALGVPAMQALAVIFGVVMTGYQFMMFNELRRQGK